LKNIFSILFILLFTVSAYAISTDEISGKVLDNEGFMPVINVNIVNLNKNVGTTTNQYGAYSIPAEVADSLIFSSIGYKTVTVVLTEMNFIDEQLLIKLEPAIYELTEIEIFNVPPPEKFKQAFLDLEIPDTMASIAMTMPILKAEPKLKFDTETGMPTYTIRGPITFLYENLHPHQRRLKQSRERLARYYVYDRKLAPVVRKVTALASEQDVKEFMWYCDLSKDFVEQATQYELALIIEQKYLVYAKNIEISQP